MAHTVVIGRFGSGKSTFGTLLVKRELLDSNRPIVTTLALNVVELNTWLQEEYPEKDCRTLQRILILNREQLATFWRFRGIQAWGEYGPEPDVWDSVDDLQGRHSDPRWKCVNQGVCYILDEAPARFHARLWAETGIEFTSYIGQHRKLGDDVFSLARHSSMLDKQFRQTADRCVILDNWYQKSFGRFIRMTAPRKIKYYEYESCPPEKGEPPFNQGEMRIDPKGLSRCFNTAGGLGISGVLGGADIGKVARGLPWWTMIIGVAAAVALFCYLAVYAMSFATRRAPKVSNALTQAAPPGKGLESFIASYRNSAASNVSHFLPGPGPAPEAARPVPAPRPVPVSELPGYFGTASSGGRSFLDTEDGLIECQKLWLSNSVAYADGVPYRKLVKTRQKQGP